MSDGYGKHPSELGIARQQSIDLSGQASRDHNLTETRQSSCVRSTGQNEWRNLRWPEEDWGRKQAVTLAYHGGEAYYGRDYAHRTHRKSYLKRGGRLGLGDALVATPQRAAEPESATQVLVI